MTTVVSEEITDHETAHLLGGLGQDPISNPSSYRTFVSVCGMGVDVMEPNANDATAAAKKAVSEAIDRVQLKRMAIANGLYWHVKLGVPFSNPGGYQSELMHVDLGKVASELPMNATLLPIQVEAGGLRLEQNSVAVISSITLQERIGTTDKPFAKAKTAGEIAQESPQATFAKNKSLERSKSIELLAHVADLHDQESQSRRSSNPTSEDDETQGSNQYDEKKITGLTTKNNRRIFVQHAYTDMSIEEPSLHEEHLYGPAWRPKTMNAAFPLKLHETLTQIQKDGHSDILGWLPHGRSFKIFDNDKFVETILPKYFVMTKKSSFLRQLNLYGFNRLSNHGPDQGSYYHEKFLRGKKFLCLRMSRQKVNGNGIRAAGNPNKEPKLCFFPLCHYSIEEMSFIRGDTHSDP